MAASGVRCADPKEDLMDNTPIWCAGISLVMHLWNASPKAHRAYLYWRRALRRKR